MREFLIYENDADQRVDKFIRKTMKTLPQSLMYKYIRNKKIKVNHKRCEISQRLQVGDQMQCYIADEFFDIEKDDRFLQVSSRLNIVYEDADFLIMHKPSGMRSHRDTKEMQDNVTDRMLHYLYKTDSYDPYAAQSFVPALCHRLDRNTEGLVIGAKTAQGLRSMNEKIALREVEKTYICIVEGSLKKKQAICIQYHQKQADQNKALISDDMQEGYHLIKTGYRVLAQCATHSLLEVDLYTGKSHQIRAVFAHLHHPLYGDVKYQANKNEQTTFQALCAYRLTFNFSTCNDCLMELQQKTFVLEENDVEKQWQKLCRKRT